MKTKIRSRIYVGEIGVACVLEKITKSYLSGSVMLDEHQMLQRKLDQIEDSVLKRIEKNQRECRRNYNRFVTLND